MCEMVKRHVSARSSIPKAPIDNNSTVIVLGFKIQTKNHAHFTVKTSLISEWPKLDITQHVWVRI